MKKCIWTKSQYCKYTAIHRLLINQRIEGKPQVGIFDVEREGIVKWIISGAIMFLFAMRSSSFYLLYVWVLHYSITKTVRITKETKTRERQAV